MKAAVDILEERISAAMKAVAGGQDCAAIVRPATDAKFGDYQANGVMALAKKLKTNPRKLAEEVVKNLDVSDICELPEVAGPGFINLKMKAEFVAGELLEINKDLAGLGIEKTREPKTIVVDFSSPNIAKEMHVGHLRSTIIGDCICRILECLGHKVIRQNHVGDWGTQFGLAFLGAWHVCMGEKCHKRAYHCDELRELKASSENRDDLLEICHRIRDRHEADWRNDWRHEPCDGEKYFGPFIRELRTSKRELSLEAVEIAYQYATLVADSVIGMGLSIPIRERDPETHMWLEKIHPYESLPRHVTAMLQEGGNDNQQERDLWEYFVGQTLTECNAIYKRLGVTLNDSHVRGESFYQRMLRPLVKRLLNKGVAESSEGAVCVFPEGFKNKDGKRLPFMIQKSDELHSHLYQTTDIAAIRYRVNKLKADAIIYVTDSRQKLHFEMLFAVARMAGWVSDKIKLTHVMFGSILGDDGTPLKTRSGESVKLKNLLRKAENRAKAVVEEKNPELSPDEKDEIARSIGIGAVKYADYSNNRTSDYVFSFDKMLAMDGNTAPYMQYAYARICSIMDKGKERGIDKNKEISNLATLSLTEPSELDLAKHLIRYGEAIQSAAEDYRPNYLTAYLYELAQKFSAFYTNCPVLVAGPEKRPTRLLLCDLTAKTIKHGLHELLGIEVVEQM